MLKWSVLSTYYLLGPVLRFITYHILFNRFIPLLFLFYNEWDHKASKWCNEYLTPDSLTPESNHWLSSIGSLTDKLCMWMFFTQQPNYSDIKYFLEVCYVPKCVVGRRETNMNMIWILPVEAKKRNVEWWNTQHESHAYLLLLLLFTLLLLLKISDVFPFMPMMLASKNLLAANKHRNPG